MRKIYLVRHGEAIDDVEDRYGGWADDELTDNGRETAGTLAKELTKFSLKKIYTSPFKRAFHTAEIISKELGIPVEVAENLKERNRYGILTSLTKTEAKEKYPDLFEEVKEYKNTITGAETYENFRDRVLKALKQILEDDREDILMVIHGGIYRVIMWELLGLPKFVEAKLLAVVELDQDGGKLHLKSQEGLIFDD